MKAIVKKSLILGAVITILLTGLCLSPALAQPQVRAAKEESAGYLGVRLMPVPEMLAVHLGLEKGKGLMVINVVEDSGSDVAGLVRYDVITTLEGNDITDYDQLVRKIRSSGEGTKVELTVISQGEKRDFTVELGAQPTEEPEWKYSSGPSNLPEGGLGTRELERQYRIEPFEDDELPFGLPEELRRFFRKEYRFRHEPDKGGTIILPDEETQEKLAELEERLSRLESQQAKILEKLDELLEEK